MKTDVVIDIETVTNPVSAEDIEAYMAAWQPPGSVKKIDTIEKYRLEAEENAAEDIAKKRAFSIGGKRMISCALGVVQDGDVVNIQSWAGDDLDSICGGVVDYLAAFRELRIIGWNHIGFDLPEIAKSLLKTKKRLRFKPGKWDIVDLCKFPFYGLKLKDTARGFGLEVPDIAGDQVAQMYADGEWEKIKFYNESDVRITGLLYDAASRIFAF